MYRMAEKKIPLWSWSLTVDIPQGDYRTEHTQDSLGQCERIRLRCFRHHTRPFHQVF